MFDAFLRALPRVRRRRRRTRGEWVSCSAWTGPQRDAKLYDDKPRTGRTSSAGFVLTQDSCSRRHKTRDIKRELVESAREVLLVCCICARGSHFCTRPLSDFRAAHAFPRGPLIDNIMEGRVRWVEQAEAYRLGALRGCTPDSICQRMCIYNSPLKFQAMH